MVMLRKAMLTHILITETTGKRKHDIVSAETGSLLWLNGKETHASAQAQPSGFCPSFSD
jgi:hypothetical protein